MGQGGFGAYSEAELVSHREGLRIIKGEVMASTISSLIGEVMITSSDGDYLREVTSRW